jgi:hypothetical protein
MLTLSQFAYQREINLPVELAVNSELRGRLVSAMKQSAEHERQGKQTLFSVENNLKRTIGRTRALADPAFNAQLQTREADLRANAPATIGNPWSDVDRAVTALRALDTQWRFATPEGDLFAPRRSGPSRMPNAFRATARARCRCARSNCSTSGRSRAGSTRC